jgi:hypothetical protein
LVGGSTQLAFVELKHKISTSSELTPLAYIKSKEIMIGILSEPCHGGGVQLMNVIEIELTTIFLSSIALQLQNNTLTLKVVDNFNGPMNTTYHP